MNSLTLTWFAAGSTQTTPEVLTAAQRAAKVINTNPWLAIFYMVVALAGIATFLSVLGMVLIYVERKLAGRFQCRLGPTRVGPFGMLQTIADTIKLLTKEDITPNQADKALHLIAPFFALLATVLMMIIIPFSPTIQVIDLNIGVVFVAAVSTFGVFGVLLGGWASNNKWSLLGGMRSGAQIISYDLSIALALITVVLFSGSLSLTEIIKSQQEGWWIWRAPVVGFLSFFLFLIASVAELNRTPFDMPEGESELTGGFSTEYSGLRFSFFFLAEFLNMFVASALAVTLFLGGWMPFYIGNFTSFNAVMGFFPPIVWFAVKTIGVMYFIIWIRWTFPRLRIDQLMHLEWKIMLPLGFANLLVGSVLVLLKLYFFPF